MGCSVTKSRSPGVVCATMRAAPTASSSGLQFEGSSSHFLDRNHLEKEKGHVLVTSSSNSPDSGRGLEFAKETNKVVGNPTLVQQRLKDKENQDFSFKANSENSVEREKEKRLSTKGNQSLFRPTEDNSRKADKNATGYLDEFAPTSIENKTGQGYSVLNDIPDAVIKNVSFACVKEQGNERAPTPGKIEFDQGLAFSFMNIRNSHLNQPTLFYNEDENIERVSQYFNLAKSSVFGVKPNESDKLGDAQKKKTILLEESSVSSISCSSPGKHNLKVMKETKDGNLSSAQGSLSVIDPIEPMEEMVKEKNMPISNTLVATSTNLGTHRTTASSIANLCQDEYKRSAFTRKFTTNLVSLVKPMNNSLQLTATKSLSSMQVPMSSSVLKPSTKVQSTPNLELKSTLLSLTKRKQEEGVDDGLILKREQTDKTTNRNDRSINLSCFDIIEDSNEPSPIAESSLPNMTKSNTPKTLVFSNGNTSFSRQVDGSTILDRTIYPLEENITRLDLDRYSINIEMGDKESFIGSPQKTPVRPGARRLSNSFNGLSKAKSAILDSQLESQINSATAIPPKRPENLYSRPKSFCEIDQDKKDTPSSATEVYLSPNRVPARSRLQQDRSMTQDLSRTNSFIETSRVDKSVDDEGQKKINQYLLIKELGKGGFGKVKLAIHAETKEQYAVKISNKNRLKRKMLTRSKSAYSLLAKEVAIMKKMDHPNIVRLVEVIDDPNHNKLYIAMEFVKKGAVFSKSYWKHEQSKKEDGSPKEESGRKINKLSEEKAKKYFRHLILALDYLHNTVGIIHRDIKPENLLIAADDTLKISDFGISEIMEGDNDVLETNAGTKSYLAPETWKGKSFRGKPADIWAAGGTLYYLLTGRPPFQGLAVDDLKKRILEDEIVFPEDLEISPGAKKLIQGCLRKDPEERITLQDIMNNDWLTDNGKFPLENNLDVDLTLSEDDIKKALTKISFMAVVYVTATLKKAHRAKLAVKRKKTQELQQQAGKFE